MRQLARDILSKGRDGHGKQGDMMLIRETVLGIT